MGIPGKNADLIRRFKFYGFGFLLGLMMVAVLFRGRSCEKPSSRKLAELEHQKLEYSKHAACRMLCRNITEAEIKQILKSGKVNYDKSNVHEKPYGTYAVEGIAADGKSLRIIIADCDTISKVVTAIDLKMEKDSCDCPTQN
jgi:hypothetical protein